MADAQMGDEVATVKVDPGGLQRPIWIVEDDPTIGELAAEITESLRAAPILFRAPLPYLLALRGSSMPDAVILDWRLEHALSSGLFLATRNRYPRLPVIYWTNSPDGLPLMVRNDPMTIVVEKAGGVESLELALRWAFEQPASVADQASETS